MADTTPPQGNMNEALNANLSGLKDVMGVVSETMKEMKDAFSAITDPTTRLKEDMDKMTLNMRSIVNFAGDWKDTMAELLGLTKKMAIGGVYDAKTYGKAKTQLQEMLALHKQLANRTGLTKDQQNILNASVDGLGKVLQKVDTHAKRLGKSMGDAMDSHIIVEVSKEMRGLVNVTEKLSNAYKKVNLGPLTSASKTISELTGKQGRLHQMLAQAERLKGAKEGVHNRIYENATKFNNRNYAGTVRNQTRYVKPAGGAAGPAQKVDTSRAQRYAASYIPTSRAAFEAMTPNQKRRAQRAATAANANIDADVNDMAPEGSNFIDRMMAKKIIGHRNAAAMKGESVSGGIIGEKGLNYMAKGGGSFTKGLGLSAEEGIGGVASKLGGLAEGAALPVAIAGGAVEIAKKMFDATVERNKDVYGKLGGAGIINSGQQGSAFGTFENVKRNLTPGGFGSVFNSLGSTYESNLKIAETMANSGVNLSELSQRGNGLGTNIVGKVGNTVRVGAKLAGMDESQGTEQVMKLLLQYHQSLDSTDKFFTKLNTDSMAAGLTSAKYIEVIDSITAGFDHMAKSLEEVTNILRVVGSTGTNTAEMLQDSMKALVGGPEKSHEQKAYLYSQMSGNSEAMDTLTKGSTSIVSNRYGEVIKNMREAGMSEDEIKQYDLTTGGGVQSAYAAINAKSNALTPGSRSAVQYAKLGASVGDLQVAMTNQDAVQKFGNDKTGAGAVGMAFQSDLNPTNPLFKMVETIQGMQNALKISGIDYKEYTANPSMALSGRQTALLSQAASVQGVAPDTFQKLAKTIMDTSSAYVNQGKLGSNDISTSEYEDMARRAGKGDLKGQAAKSAVGSLTQKELADLTLKYADKDTLFKAAPGSSLMNSMEDAITNGMNKAAEVDKAKSLTAATRPTADIFAAAFTNLFNMLSGSIGDILGWLKSTGGHAASSSDIKDLSDNLHGKNGGVSVDANAEKVRADAAMNSANAKMLDDYASDSKNSPENIAAAKKLSDALKEKAQAESSAADAAVQGQTKADTGQLAYKEDIKTVSDAASRLANAATPVGMNKDGSLNTDSATAAQMAKLGLNPVASAQAVIKAATPAAGTPTSFGDVRPANVNISVGNIQQTAPNPQDALQGAKSEQSSPVPIAIPDTPALPSRR